jgi:hypothetical protein
MENVRMCARAVLQNIQVLVCTRHENACGVAAVTAVMLAGTGARTGARLSLLQVSGEWTRRVAQGNLRCAA